MGLPLRQGLKKSPCKPKWDISLIRVFSYCHTTDDLYALLTIDYTSYVDVIYSSGNSTYVVWEAGPLNAMYDTALSHLPRINSVKEG